MKITFDPISTNHPAEQSSRTYSATVGDRTSLSCGYAVDISGKVMDNNAYGQGRTAKEVMQELGMTDVSVMRDYLTVMSHSMSAEDFHKMQQEGFDPSHMDVKESVTILDHIKAALLKGGVVVDGFTTDMSNDVLREVTGTDKLSVSVEQALRAVRQGNFRENDKDIKEAREKASALMPLEEAATKYLVENNLPLSIDSLYQAEHSAQGDGNRQGHGYYTAGIDGYYARKPEQVDLKALEPQCKKVMEEAGLPDSEENLQEAGWLVEKGIPLTGETLTKLHQIRGLEIPLSKELVESAIGAALLDGKTAGAGDLTDPRSLLEKAYALEKEVAGYREEQAEKVVASGRELTLEQLRRTSCETEAGEAAENRKQFGHETEAELQEKLLHAGMVLHRTQLMMTAAANLKLMKSGYAIDTAPLEELVTRLEQLEEEQKKDFWNADTKELAENRALLYQNTTGSLERLKMQPAAALASFIRTDNSVGVPSWSMTLGALEQEGAALQKKYREANQSYEQMKSEPRADLGDSIQKAFANVDDILLDLELELHEMNRRAVRILGYNGMDISPELIAAVKQMDAGVQSVIEKMTPAAALQIIRDGKNPLEMSFQELQEYLESFSGQEERKEQSLGKFIYSLEQKKAITEEEKQACIGIYRVFRQIEKKDHRMIGRLVRSGQEPTFKNVLAALRSEKKKGKEYTIDDSFGGMEAKPMGLSVTEQIAGAFYRNLAARVADTAEPEQVLGAMDKYGIRKTEDVETCTTTLEQMASDILSHVSYDEEKKEAVRNYEEQQFADFGQELALDRDTFVKLMDLELPTTPANGKAFEELVRQPQDWYLELCREVKKREPEEQAEMEARILKAADRFLTSMEEEDSGEMDRSYREMTDALSQNLALLQESTDSYLDLKALQSARRQLHVAAGLKNRGRWEIPVTIQEENTLVHVTFRTEQEQKGRVDITFSSEKLGKVAASFYAGSHLGGYILCESEAVMESLESRKEELEHLVSGKISVLQSDTIETNQFLAIQKSQVSSDIEDEAVTNRALYRIAAGFIKACSR